ncbi:MAG: hypothetical protein R8M45_04440 [Ghiorsea sp.]
MDQSTLNKVVTLVQDLVITETDDIHKETIAEIAKLRASLQKVQSIAENILISDDWEMAMFLAEEILNIDPDNFIKDVENEKLVYSLKVCEGQVNKEQSMFNGVQEDDGYFRGRVAGSRAVMLRFVDLAKKVSEEKKRSSV